MKPISSRAIFAAALFVAACGPVVETESDTDPDTEPCGPGPGPGECPEGQSCRPTCVYVPGEGCDVADSDPVIYECKDPDA